MKESMDDFYSNEVSYDNEFILIYEPIELSPL